MKKYLIKLLCILAVLTMILPMTALANDGDYLVRWIKTDNGKGLNLRTAPDRNADIIEVLPYRMQVYVCEINANATWSHISMQRPNGKGFGDVIDGWVMTSFLVKSDPGPYKNPSPKKTAEPVQEGPTFNDVNSAARSIKYLDVPYEAVIKTRNPANYVHLRWFPSTSANYIEKYLRDTEILVLAESKTWAQVQILTEDTPSYVGFILKSNVEPLDLGE
ncbi:MAG: SH3 domain-containing protein [Clostridia bacterium]|nr:SH3 domain-containing protein [Clostridia bacterium]